MLAFDDHIAITTPCNIGVDGGIIGGLLTSAVDRSHVAEVAIVVSKDGSAATFNLGNRIKLKLAVMSVDNKPFVMPEPDRAAVLKIDRNKLDHALRFILQSVGHDVTYPEWHGVTFEAVDKELHIFSGYSQVLARAVVPLDSKPKFKRLVVHEKFCTQVLTYPTASLSLHDNHALLECEAASVFGRALTGTGKLDLGKVVDGALERAESFVDMPDLTRMLGRALLFEGDHLNMELSVVRDGKDTRVRMRSDGPAGELIDYSKAIDKSHTLIDVQTNAKHLKAGAILQEMCIGSKEIVMRGDAEVDIVMIVSVAPSGR